MSLKKSVPTVELSLINKTTRMTQGVIIIRNGNVCHQLQARILFMSLEKSAVEQRHVHNFAVYSFLTGDVFPVAIT